jgi:predicted transcriptional regulator
MTTLARLFEKGFLRRRKMGRAFLYSQRISKAEKLGKDLAADLHFLVRNCHSVRQALIDQLVEAMEQVDGTLLDELERRIQEKRRALTATRSPGES